tara:strand:- start:86375 stop:87556 length:1182 start_codon:yes stop_codon:yes gene_type:complete
MLHAINSQNDTPLGLYVHWPYCLSKCPYCDFNSHVASTIDYEAFKTAYRRELQHFASQIHTRPLHSIFFGGGTPSLMPPHLVESIIDDANEIFGLEQGCEITLEANPTSFETKKFKDFKAAGINRVSIGVQSLNDDDLKFLGRQHSSSEALAAIQSAQKIFDRLSFDLIYARPQQTIAQWQAELTKALDYGTNHLSLYQLTIEQGTAFHTQYQRGDFTTPNEFLAADLYDATQEITARYGLPSYETSNHAGLGDESRHNLIYWRYHDYIGIGPGAHGRYRDKSGQKKASRTHLAPQKWLEKCAAHSHGAHPLEDITPAMSFTESVMMGLRLKEGIHLQALAQRAGVEWQQQINLAKLQMLEDENFLHVSADTHVSASAAGALCINVILDNLLN